MKLAFGIFVIWKTLLTNEVQCRLSAQCKTNQDCNDPNAADTVPFSYCRIGQPNLPGVCVCHPWFTASTTEGSAGTCRRGVIGSACSMYGEQSDLYCSNGIGNGAICDPSGGRCRCADDQEQLRDKCGALYCHPIGEGSSCSPGQDGDRLCQRALKDTAATCHPTTKVCVCGSGKLYSHDLASCIQMPTAPLRESVCKACIETGGKCYTKTGDFPDTCECPKCKATSPNRDWRNVGCDQVYAFPGDMCSQDRNIVCHDPHSECVHSGILADVNHCVCCPGYVEVCDTMGEPCMKKCVKEVSRKEDKNCEKCWARGGRCYQDSPLEDDLNVGIGCLCPTHLSTSNPMDPKTFCDTEHLNVTCTAESMKICYDPTKHTKFPGVTKELMERKARLFIEYHQHDVQCQFRYETSVQMWCLDLDLHSAHGHDEDEHRCGIHVTHPSRSTISFSSVVVLQRQRYKITVNDFCVCVYCVFDTAVEVYTGLVVGKKVRYSGGHVISPDLYMYMQGEHSKLGYLASVAVADNIRLCIEMTDDKNVYDAIQAMICIASSSPHIFNKRDTRSCLLINGACVTDNAYIGELDNFRPLPTDRKHICTGYFPAFRFVNTDAVYFHCAVKTCRDPNDCAPVNCTCPKDTGREKRSPIHYNTDTVTHTSEHHVIRWKRAVEVDALERAIEAFQDPNLVHEVVGITVLPDEELESAQPVMLSSARDVIEKKAINDPIVGEEEDLEITDEEDAMISQTMLIVLSVLVTAFITFTASACIYFRFFLH